MPEVSMEARLQRGAALRRALAGLLCLVLLLAGGLHASHAAEPHAASAAFAIAADGDEPGHHHAGGHAHGLGASCSHAHGCAMSAALAVMASLSPPPAALVALGRDRLQRGIDTLPRPRPPKLSAAA
jgi:hypothetical protein